MNNDHSSQQRRMYWRFAAMIATSTVVMFALTYTNVYDVEHIEYSQERVYMAILMGGAMALVMLSFMVSMMYRSRILNTVVVVTALVLAGTALYASRSQLFVDDERYMEAMIPHHSIAILTSERADIDDVRVRELADEIIRTQRVEIAEMQWLLDDIEENGPATTEAEAEDRPVPQPETAAAGPLPAGAPHCAEPQSRAPYRPAAGALAEIRGALTADPVVNPCAEPDHAQR